MKKSKNNEKRFLIILCIFVIILGIFMMSINWFNRQELISDSSSIEKTIKREISYSDEINIVKINNNFARVTIQYKEIDGDNYIMVKENGKWIIVTTDGQAFPDCGDLDKYQVPSSFYRGCFLNGEFRKGNWL